ncbi:MAG TPA: serine/threonine-protein kinase [Terriglobales bacterium]|jgi:serine/threonine-protein kinase|nr:serine/threonine-protein kinase [Terriglobales bacterium]
MRHLSDNAVASLRDSVTPDLSGTRYRLIDEAGRGGMGIVYVAEDALLQRRVALKVLEAADVNASRLMREAHVLARLEHPGIVPVHDVGTLPDGRIFYAMKFVEGQRLDQHIEPQTSVPDRLRIFLRLCDAVAFAHARGILHRDMKPANVMVGPFGEVLVMDWGLAKLLDGMSEPAEPGLLPTGGGTGHGSVLGTAGYMSPEQSRGEVESLDARSDIFSLGALLRFMLVGKPMPRPLAAICGKACAEDREDRYAAVSELTLDVSRYLDGLSVSAHRESIFDKMARFYRRNRFLVLLIAAYLVVRVGLILFFKR